MPGPRAACKLCRPARSSRPHAVPPCDGAALGVVLNDLPYTTEHVNERLGISPSGWGRPRLALDADDAPLTLDPVAVCLVDATRDQASASRLARRRPVKSGFQARPRAARVNENNTETSASSRAIGTRNSGSPGPPAAR